MLIEFKFMTEECVIEDNRTKELKTVTFPNVLTYSDSCEVKLGDELFEHGVRWVVTACQLEFRRLEKSMYKELQHDLVRVFSLHPVNPKPVGCRQR